MSAVQTPSGPVSNLALFNMQTHRNRRMLSAITGVNAFGQVYHADLLQVGYLSSIDVIFSGTVSITAQSAATANTCSPYFPWNMIKQIALTSNEGLQIYRTRGYTNHIINSLRRGGVSAGLPVCRVNTAPGTNIAAPSGSLIEGLENPFASTVGSAVPLATFKVLAVGTSGSGAGTVLMPYSAVTPGTATDTTCAFSIHYRIPVAADLRLTAGALLLQNQATRVGLDITTCNVQDWVLGTAGVNITAMKSLSAQFTIRQNFFSVPADPAAQPDTGFVHRWIEDTYPWTAVGDQQILLPVNDVYMRALCELEVNAGASAGNIVPYSAADGVGLQPAAWWTTANRADTGNNLGNLTVSYAGSQFPEQYPAAFGMIDQYYDYGEVLPDGWLNFDFDLGAGAPELGFNGRDVYDTSSLTQFGPIINWASATAPPAGSSIWVAREVLSRRAA